VRACLRSRLLEESFITEKLPRQVLFRGPACHVAVTLPTRQATRHSQLAHHLLNTFGIDPQARRSELLDLLTHTSTCTLAIKPANFFGQTDETDWGPPSCCGLFLGVRSHAQLVALDAAGWLMLLTHLSPLILPAMMRVLATYSLSGPFELHTTKTRFCLLQ
jgi:hypothetical protein